MKVILPVCLTLFCVGLGMSADPDAEKERVGIVVKEFLEAKVVMRCDVRLNETGKPSCANVEHLVRPVDARWKRYTPPRAYLGESIIIAISDDEVKYSRINEDGRIYLGQSNRGEPVFRTLGEMRVAIKAAQKE